MSAPWPAPVLQATDAAAGGNPLSPYANARLLQFQNLIPGDMDSPRLWRHVFECFLRRGNYITAKENGPGVDTGDFTYSGFICRASRLPLQSTDPLDWLSASLPWQQDNLRVATRAEGTVQVPCRGLIWLGDLSLLSDPPDSEADPRLDSRRCETHLSRLGAAQGRDVVQARPEARRQRQCAAVPPGDPCSGGGLAGARPLDR